MNKENLSRGNVRSIQVRNGAVLRGETGVLWLTFEGERSDIILGRGELWKATKQGQVVVQAMTDASFSMEKKVRKISTDLVQQWKALSHRDLLRL